MSQNDSQKTLDEVMDAMSEELQSTAIDNQFPYMFSKAKLYLRIGADKYKKDDFFGQPSTSDSDVLELIKTGCFQLCQGKGLCAEDPFTGLGVSGFSNLLALFHFRHVSRQTKHGHVINDQRGALDCITFKHEMDGRTATYYNFCSHAK